MTNVPLKLNEIFSVEEILKSKGYEVSKISALENLLFPVREMNSGLAELTYEVFSNSKLRKELKSILYKGEIAKSESVQKLIAHEDFSATREKFNNTFEWFTGELMFRKFSAFSYAIGVEVKNIQRNTTGTDAGDFDA